MSIRLGICAECEAEFVHERPGGPMPARCPTCTTERNKALGRYKMQLWREANPERARGHWNKHNRKRLADPEHLREKRENEMRRAYGLSPEDFAGLVAAQDGRCAICHGPPNGPGRRLHVDHCHETGRIRGLLCAKCNTAIGLLNDDPVRAEVLVSYLRQSLTAV